MPSFDKFPSGITTPDSITPPTLSSLKSETGRRSFDTEDIGRKSSLEGRRLRSFFHRSYFVEQKKFLRGQQAHHPLLLADITECRTEKALIGHNFVQSKRKQWEYRFSEFLSNVINKIPRSSEVTDTEIEVSK